MNIQKSKKIYFCGNNFFMLSNFRWKTIEEFAKSGNSVTLIARSDGFENDFRKLQNKLIFKSYKSKKRLFEFLFYIFYISRIFFKENSGYFFTYSSQSNVIYGLLNNFKSHQIFMNVTGLGALWDLKIMRPFVRLLFIFSFRKANTIFCQNERDFRIINKLVNKKTKVLRIYGSGVDLNKFTTPEKDRNFENIKFAMVTRLKKKKGYEIFLKASEKLNQAATDCKCILLAGYGSSKSDISKLKEKYKSTQIKTFQENMEDFYKNVDCVVLPSTYNEGTPKALIEAIASGCAIITLDRPGCCDTVIDQKNGYLMKSVSEIELFNLMNKYIYLDKKKKKEIAVESRNLAEKYFNQENIIKLYQECIK